MLIVTLPPGGDRDLPRSFTLFFHGLLRAQALKAEGKDFSLFLNHSAAVQTAGKVLKLPLIPEKP